MKQYLLIIFLLLSFASYTQNFLSWQYTDRYYSAYIGSGNAIYFGELNSAKKIQEDLSHLTLGMEARLLNKVSARVEAIYYNIRGNDKFAADSSFQKQRNLSFKSNNLELSIQGVFYLRKYNGDYFKRWNLDPYISLGVGFTSLNPYAEFEDEKVFLRPLQTEGVDYDLFTLILPASAGLKFKINEFVNLNFEIAYRYTFSDYLDDVSGDYAALTADDLVNSLSNRKDEIPIINQDAYNNLIPGQPRGNASDKDSYLFLIIKMEFFLPAGSKAIFSKSGAY